MKREDYIQIAAVAACITLALSAFLVFKAVHKDSQLNTQSSGNLTDAPTTSTPPSERDANGCYTPETVRSHYGENDCVDFTVAYTHETSAGTKFIDEKEDYTSGFVVYIPNNAAFSSVELSQFASKQIKATGLIKEYNGYPEIEADNYSQIKIYQ